MKSFCNTKAFYVLLFILPYLPSFAQSKAEGEEHILFLHLRLNDSTVTLINTKEVPGTLKQRAESKRAYGIVYYVRSSDGTLLFKNTIEDPAYQRLEYEDPDYPNKIVTKLVENKTLEFSIRIPVLKGMEYVSFERLKPDTTVKDKSGVARIPLGSISIHSKEDDQ